MDNPFDYNDYDDYDWSNDLIEPIVCEFCHEDCAEDVDCESCGLKFWIRSCQYGKGKSKPWPTQCERCKKGIPPAYEY